MPFEQSARGGHKGKGVGQTATAVSSAAIAMVEGRASAEAFDWRGFYSENWQWIARVVRRFGGPGLDVEEAVQDVFLVLVDRLREFEGRSELSTWVYRVAMNVASEHRRRAWRKRRLAAAWNVVAFWREGAASPARDAERKDEIAMVHRALATLSEKKRHVFVLCELEEMSSDDAAAVLNVPAATVRTRLFHARKEFAVAIEAMGGGE